MTAAAGLPDDLEVLSGPVTDYDELWKFISETGIAQSGRTGFSRDIFDTWLSMPNFNQETDLRLVRDSRGELVATAWVDNRAPYIATDSGGFVAPDRLDEGIGSYGLDWALAQAIERIDKAPEGARVSFGAEADPLHEPSVGLLTDAGLEVVRYFLEMRVNFDGTPQQTTLPDGIRFEHFDPDGDIEPLMDSVNEAFRDHYGYVERPRKDDLEWFQRFLGMPSVDPELTYLAMDGDEIAGANVCLTDYEGDESVGYVAILSVRRPWRRRGVAKAMLQASFADFAGRGKEAVTLHVDAENPTGATRLYESVGMRESHRTAWYERELRSGEELSVR